MTQTAIATDNITLVEAKQQAIVFINEDDALFQQYIAGSLDVAEKYCHRHFLERTYDGTPAEVLGVGGVYTLSVPDRPTVLNYVSGGLAYEVLDEDYSYFNGKLQFTIDSAVTIDSITALTGFNDIPAGVTNARLLLISSAYSYREDIIDLRVMSLVGAGAVTSILDNESRGSL